MRTPKEIADILIEFELALRGRLRPNTITLYKKVVERLLSGGLNARTIKTKSRRAQVLAVISWLKEFRLVPQDEEFWLPSKEKVIGTNRKSQAKKKRIEESDFLKYLARLPTTEKGTQLHVISRLGYYSGLRMDEARKIKPDDISYKADKKRWIVVVQGKGRYNKEGKPRSVPIRKEDVIDVQKMVPFTVSYGYVKNMTRKYLEKIGITSSFHGFRHSFATNMINAGVPPQDIQEILGHSDIRITVETYVEARGAYSPALSKLGF